MFMQRIYYGGGYMKSFSYIAQDGKGKQVKGLINAENEQEFLKKVKDKGLFVKDYKESDSDNAKSIYKFNTKELSFCGRVHLRARHHQYYRSVRTACENFVGICRFRPQSHTRFLVYAQQRRGTAILRGRNAHRRFIAPV